MISNSGRVARIKDGKIDKILKPGVRPDKDYRVVSLSKNGKRKTHAVHRLVAEAFLGEQPPGKRLVLHKNDDKSDNKFTNLY